MIAVWIMAGATILSIVAIIHVALTFRNHLHLADKFADQFVDAVEEISKDPAFPREVVLMLFSLARGVDSIWVAIRIGAHVSSPHKKHATRRAPKVLDKDVIEFQNALNRMPHRQKERFVEVMGIFLAAIAYRDPVFGQRMRAELMGNCRENAIKKGATALAGMFHDNNHLAHA